MARVLPHDDARARDACIAAIASVLGRHSSSERAVRAALRGLPQLDNEGRRRVARRIIGAGVLRVRLAWRARVPVDDAEALLDAYVALEEWEGEKGEEAEEAEEAEAAPTPGRRGAVGEPRPWPEDPVERMAVERSAPAFLVRELVRSLGHAGADAFLAVSNEPGPTTLRAHVGRIDRDSLQARLRDEGVETTLHATVPTALVVTRHANLLGTQAWRQGLFEVQDASSQQAALWCGVRRGDVVVDLCAGRGGKTLALAALLGDSGTLHVHDVDAASLRDLRPRVARAGATRVVEGLPTPGSADVVLVDAPCSSLGPLRRSPDLRFALRPEDLEGFPALQRELLVAGRRLTRPGGRLVYATCTVRKEENEEVARAVAEAEELTLLEEHLLLPHVHGCDGFYVAIFRVP